MVFKVLCLSYNSVGNIFSKCYNIDKRGISKVRMVTELMGYPCKPKKPLNGYFRFLQQCRSELSEKAHSMKSKDFVKEIGQRWCAMSESEKEKYNKEYEKELSIFIAENEKYMLNLSAEEKEQIKNLKREINYQKTLKIPCVVSDKVKRELNKPKPPLQSFLRFSKSVNLKNGKSSANNMKLLSEQWKNLPSSEKEKYKEEFKKEYDEYLKTLEKWEENMLKKGKIEVVRLKKLKQMLQEKHS